MSTYFTYCPSPGCEAAATVERHDLWPSTDGEVLMAKVIGVCGHWFNLPASALDLSPVVDWFREESSIAS